MAEARYGRAAFLSVVGLGGLGIVAGDRIRGALSGPIGAVGDAVPNQLSSLVPTAGWRIYAISPPWPTFHPGSYRLRLTGEVEHPLELDWVALRDLPTVAEVRDFHCVTGWIVRDVHWEGIRLDTLFRMVRPTARARYLNVHSMERNYFDTLSLQQATMPGVLLAHTMDGAPLPRPHGAPLRLIVPQMYGYKNVKWVSHIEFTHKLRPGYWEQNGYDVDAWIGRSNGF